MSTADPASTLFQAGLLATPSWLVAGTVSSLYPYTPYESLTGTSMAAPFVSGAIALMLEANPNLTPNLIKAILEYTAIAKPGVSALRQGAGFMNVSHAVSLAALAANNSKKTTTTIPIPTTWARHIMWGNHMLSGGVINPEGQRLETRRRMGLGEDQERIDGDNIVWGTAGRRRQHRLGHGNDGDNIVWGTASDGDNIVWGTNDGDNIVWGTDCGGADCDNIVWGTSDGDNIVWGTAQRRRQHRLGHGQRRRQHRLGHRQRRRQHRLGDRPT